MTSRTTPPTGSTRTLIRLRLRTIRNRGSSRTAWDTLRMAAIAVLVAIVLGRWALDRMTGPLAATGAVRETVRMEAYRLGAFLAAITGFVTFGTLWRNPDMEILNRFPIPPKALFHYRLLEMGVRNLPFLAVGLLSGLSLAWHGYPTLALEICVYLLVLFVETLAWSMYWHAFAGNSVGTPSFDWLKQNLAGAMVLKDRTLLLYSPFLAAASGFVFGLLVLIGLTTISRGHLATGAGLVLAVLPPLVWAYRHGETALARGYYRTLAALAEGETLGELGESAPAAGFLGEWYATRAPASIRPLVVKDMRQAWRRNRPDHIVLLTATGVLSILAAGRSRTLLETGWTWPAIWAILALAAGQAFGMTRQGSDAPWQWLSLPTSIRRHYAGRLVATAFYPFFVSPWLALAAHAAGASWGTAIGGTAGMAAGATVVATNVAAGLFGNVSGGWVVFLAAMSGAYALSSGSVVVGAEVLAAAALLSALLLVRLPRRLAELEQKVGVGV